MIEIRVRPANADDVAAFAEIAANIDTNAASPTDLERSLATSTSRSFIAETPDGKSLGTLEARIAGDDLEIIMLTTLKTVRRRGVASQLLAALVAQATGDKATRIILDVAVGNTAARQLYAANRFIEVATRPGYYRPGRPGRFGVACDALLLERRLAG